MSRLTETEIRQEADAGRNSTACLPLITTAVMRKSFERRSRELIHSHSFVFWLQLKTWVSPFPPRDPRSPGTGFVFRRRPTSSASRRGICRGRRPPLDRPAPSSRWSPSRSAASGGRPVCSRCNLRRRVEREEQDRDPGGSWRWVTAEYCVSRTVRLRPCVCVSALWFSPQVAPAQWEAVWRAAWRGRSGRSLFLWSEASQLTVSPCLVISQDVLSRPQTRFKHFVESP